MAFRIDRGNLNPPKRLADGRIRVDAYITRTGVFNYVLPDGSTRREYRPPDEVFREDSLATFSMVPVTDDHPPVMLSAETAKQYTVGVTGDQARRDGDYVHLPMMILDASTIKKMESGKIQVSAGYECDCEETPGVSPAGDHYDAIQRNIAANHVALVAQGRAGAGAAVRMDGVGIQEVFADTPSVIEKRTVIMDLKEALEQAAKANARADAADAKAQLLTTEVEKLKGERDALTSAIAKEQAARKDAVDSIDGRVRARVALESRAAAVLRGVDLTKMDDRAIKVAVIKHLDSATIEATASDAYVDGRFDASIERAEASAKALGDVRQQGEAARLDASQPPVDREEKARLDMIEANRSYHLPPVRN